MDIIEIENLSFRYPVSAEKALDGVSLRVKEGDFVVLCGESGCGKTTLLRLIKPELAPRGELSGGIRYKGTPVGALDGRTAAGEIGYVLQNPETQIVTDKVWHELAFGLESLGEDQQAIRRRVAEMASYFGIEDWFLKKTADLSGGQKQLLNLASVMVMQPKALLLDEPTAQLDPIAASEFIATLKKLNRELGLTVVLAEHRLEEVFPVADMAAVMEKNTVILYDTPRGVGEKLRNYKGGHHMLLGLPSSVRIYNALRAGGDCPLTVREGRDFLSARFKNDIDRLNVGEKRPAVSPSVEVRDVWFRYEKNLPDVLRGLTFSAYPGEILSVLGGNGVGKTTALNVISGQDKAYKGSVWINGKKLGKYASHELYHRNLALLPQNPQSVFLKPSVLEDYEDVAAAHCPSGEKEALIAKIAEMMGISHLLKTHPYDLSGGEQQKAALGKVLLLCPKILLLDEPTKGIDAYSKAALGKILQGLKREGLTVVMVTHDVEFAAEYSDNCAMFFDGEIVSSAPPREFFSDNNFYTTAASRLSRHLYKNAVLCGDVVKLCEMNGEKNE